MQLLISGKLGKAFSNRATRRRSVQNETVAQQRRGGPAGDEVGGVLNAAGVRNTGAEGAELEWRRVQLTARVVTPAAADMRDAEQV